VELAEFARTRGLPPVAIKWQLTGTSELSEIAP
jgi:hypothetical protein